MSDDKSVGVMCPSVVAVYGSAGYAEGSADYQLAYAVGRLLAARGCTVMTGGYTGAMQAASQGALAAGGRTLGITSDQIEAWRPLKPNPWVQQEHRVATFRERLIHLVLSADAAIALPGGAGTLAEIALYWNAMIVEEMPVKPLVLVGAQWQQTLSALMAFGDAYVPPHQRNLLRFAETAAQAVDVALGSAL